MKNWMKFRFRGHHKIIRIRYRAVHHFCVIRNAIGYWPVRFTPTVHWGFACWRWMASCSQNFLKWFLPFQADEQHVIMRIRDETFPWLLWIWIIRKNSTVPPVIIRVQRIPCAPSVTNLQFLQAQLHKWSDEGPCNSLMERQTRLSILSPMSNPITLLQCERIVGRPVAFAVDRVYRSYLGFSNTIFLNVRTHELL